jgi:hypothetical protein
MRSFLHARWRPLAAVLALGGALAGALLIPVPTTPDPAQAAVRGEVRDRLPGWRIDRVSPSWEGAYTVVATCEGLQLGFQFVPGHGLPADDAWIQPNDAYARDRLWEVSDSRRVLVWYGERRRPQRLSCYQELARLGEEPLVPQVLD